MVVESKHSQQSSKKDQKPWWNRPLFGELSLIARLFPHQKKQAILETPIKLHQTTFAELKWVASRCQGLDQAKFGNEDFLAYIRLNRKIQANQPPYHGLVSALAMLKAGITAHQSFMALEQVEFTHRGLRFNEMYDFVEALCIQRVQAETFRRQVRAKATELYPRLKSHEGQQALHQYAQHLERIAHHELSLNLLFAFKKLNFQRYHIFKQLSDLIQEVQRQELIQLETMTAKVFELFESFDNLGKILGLNEQQRTVNTYGILFQFIAMSEKHKTAFNQFESLATQLEQWKSLEEKLNQIRTAFPGDQYIRPREFSASLAGAQLYKKYQPYFE